MFLMRAAVVLSAAFLVLGCGAEGNDPGDILPPTSATSADATSIEPTSETPPTITTTVTAPATTEPEAAPESQAPEPMAAEPYIVDCQMGLGPVITYWSDGSVTGYSEHCQAVHDRALAGEVAANTPVCDGTICRYPSGAEMPDPNAPAVEIDYTCGYDVLCDEAGNVIPGPGGPENGVLLGNGQTCAGNGCTRPR